MTAAAVAERRTHEAPTFVLTRAHHAELGEAVQRVRRAWVPLLDVRRENFPLPTLGPELARIAADLDSAPGVCVLRGLPTHGDVRRSFWGIGRHLGVAVPQDTTGRLLVTVGSACPGHHSGGSDVTAFLAVDGPRNVSLIESSALHEAVSARRPDLAERFFDLIPFDAAGLLRLAPLACRSEGRLSLRYNRAAIERAELHPGAPTPTVEHRELLDLVDAVLPELRRELTLRAGDVLLVNNHETLHRVEPPQPKASSGLLRLWLTLREGRPLPDSYVWPTPTYGAEPGRGGAITTNVIDRSNGVQHPR